MTICPFMTVVDQCCFCISLRNGSLLVAMYSWAALIIHIILTEVTRSRACRLADRSMTSLLRWSFYPSSCVVIGYSMFLMHAIITVARYEYPACRIYVLLMLFVFGWQEFVLVMMLVYSLAHFDDCTFSDMSCVLIEMFLTCFFLYCIVVVGSYYEEEMAFEDEHRPKEQDDDDDES